MGIPIDTVLLITAIVLFRYFLFLMKRPIHRGSKPAWIIIIFATMLLCASPLILIKKEIIESSVLNILISGFALFYFPFVASKMPEKGSISS